MKENFINNIKKKKIEHFSEIPGIRDIPDEDNNEDTNEKNNKNNNNNESEELENAKIKPDWMKMKI